MLSFSKWASIMSTSSNPDAALLIVCCFTQPCVTCFLLAHKIDGTKETQGCVKILTAMLVLFFGFEIWPNPIFCVGKFLAIFSGFRKISAIFLGMRNIQLFFGLPITHLNPFNEEHTVQYNKKT